MPILLLILVALPLSAADMTPLDSLYDSDSLNMCQKVLLKPIQIWQRFSYGQPSLNCQFERSCSNYMVQAIREKGVIKGSVIGTDRIIRCNPAARGYHLKHAHARIQYDGRLVDPLTYLPAQQPARSPLLAAGLSIVPGLGRSYAGQPIDGLFSFLLVAGFAYNTYSHHQTGNAFMVGWNASIMSIIWMADIYGAYRTASQIP